MTATDLLPSNSTQLERDLSRSGDFLPRLGPGVQRIRDAKRKDIPDSVVPWLIYEYGLGEILPYVPDLRQALAKGIQWQRLRGTRAAIGIGLSWIGFDAEIEESEAGTLRWADFQLGLDQAPPNLEFTNNVIQVSRLSAPIRSRLFRIYGGYDHRRLKLDDHVLSGGSWLCDHTGVYLREDWPQLSFGRVFQESASFTDAAVFTSSVERTHTDQGWYEDRMILDVNQLSELVWREWHMVNMGAVISRGHLTEAGPWWQPTSTWTNYAWDQGLDWAGLVNRIQPALKFAKAGVYLSDQCILGETNTVLPALIEVETGVGAFLLSEGDPTTGENLLSEHVRSVAYQEINERFDRDHSTVFVAAADVASHVCIKREHRRLVDGLDDQFLLDQHLLSDWELVSDRAAITRNHMLGRAATTETPDTWEAISWNQGTWWLGSLLFVNNRTDSKAGIYLSEGQPLGETNTRFNVAEELEIGYDPFLLSEADPSQAITAADYDALADYGYLQESGQGVLVLSDSNADSGSGILSEHVSNALLVLPAAEYQASGLNRLSQHLVSSVWVAVDEVFERFHHIFDPHPDPIGGIQTTITREHQRVIDGLDDQFLLDQHRIGEFSTIVDIGSVSRGHAYSSLGLVRHPATWDDSDWQNSATWYGLGAVHVTSQPQAHLFLSDGLLLGETLAVLGAESNLRIDRTHQIEDLVAKPVGGDLEVVERHTQRVIRALDDRFFLSEHLLSEFNVAFGEFLFVSREHCETAIGQPLYQTHWGAADWIQAGHEWSLTERVAGCNTRFHTAWATYTTATFETRLHVRTLLPTTWHWYTWSTWDTGSWYEYGPGYTWNHGAEQEWQLTSWGQAAWIEGTEDWIGLAMWATQLIPWNPTSLSIETRHSTHI